MTPIPARGQTLRVMTFNVRYGTAEDGKNAWTLRRDLLMGVIRDFGPDILGVQEALVSQIRELDEGLPDHDWVGVGRDDGDTAGEFSAVYYRRDRLELLDQGTFWFSDTPEVPGSMSWGNALPRICTWARFQDREAGRTLLVFNLHWDHQSQPSRERAARFLLERIQGRPHPQDRVLVTGDFNAGETNPAFRSLLESPDIQLRDSFRALHPDADGVGTFHGFEGGTDGDKIDAVLLGPGWRAVEAAILRSDEEGRFPSDHYPVSAVVDWGPRGGLPRPGASSFSPRRRGEDSSWTQARPSSIDPGGT